MAKLKNILNAKFVLLILCCSCSQEPPPHGHWDHFPVMVQISSSLDLEALEIYNVFFGVEVFTPVDEDQNFVDCTIHLSDDLGYNILGSTNVWFNESGVIHTCEISILRRLEGSTNTYSHVLAHELGHALGIQHAPNDDVDSIMYHNVNRNPDITDQMEGYLDEEFWGLYDNSFN